MRALSYLAIASGLLVLAIVLATPLIVEWQAHQLLDRFNSGDLAPQLIEQRLEQLRAHRAISSVLALAVIVGGVLTMRHRVHGLSCSSALRRCLWRSQRGRSFGVTISLSREVFGGRVF
jgi:hypothetical protein